MVAHSPAYTGSRFVLEVEPLDQRTKLFSFDCLEDLAAAGHFVFFVGLQPCECCGVDRFVSPESLRVRVVIDDEPSPWF